MGMTEKQLLQQKEAIQTAKTTLSELKGEEKALTKQLKENWKCNDLVEAKRKIKQLEKESEELTQEIDEKTTLLEQKMSHEES
jgi:uncharacterized protein YPO0396